MLLSTKDQGLGRRRHSYSHGHVYSLNKTARSSKLSLLSAITTLSSGSNGSNSTVTQESYNKSQSETSRKKRSSKRRKETDRSKLPCMDAVEEAISEGGEQNAEVDVFEFLVDEDGAVSSGDSTEVPIDATPATHGNDTSPQSLHSDSGISMDDGSIITGQPTTMPLLPLLEDQPSSKTGETPQMRFDFTWPEVPKPKYPTIMPIIPDNRWSTIEDVQEHHNNGTHSPHAYCFTPESPSSRHPSVASHEAIVSALGQEGSSSSSLPFKAFGQTCRGILFSLQSDVADLEYELNRIKACIDDLRKAGEGPTSASGRRGSWHFTHYHANLSAGKADVSARLHMKIEQYYQLLLLSQKVEKLKTSSMTPPEEVDKFRSWLKGIEDLPIPVMETHLRYLQDEGDLVTLTGTPMKAVKDRMHDNIWRMILGLTLLLAALLLQIVSDLRVRILVCLQIIGIVVALCLA